MLNRMRLAAFTLVVALVGLASPVMATDVTIPDYGVDFVALVSAAGVKLGTVVVGIVTVYFAFLIIRKAMRWSKSIA